MQLTGQADLSGAAEVVNEGGVFRFLLKPIAPEALERALVQGVEQHRLVTAERDLLERTLHGSVKALTELLGLACPPAFARATRMRRMARMVLESAGIEVTWQLDLAMMLSQVGAITLPPDVLDRLDRPNELTPAEREMVTRIPLIADQVLADIPRLEEVRAAIRDQDDPVVDDLTMPPLGARLLRVVRDFDLLETAGQPHDAILRRMTSKTGRYDPQLLDALAAVVASLTGQRILAIGVDDLVPGMVLADDIVTCSGVKLVPRGHEVTISLLERIRNFSAILSGIEQPVHVYGRAHHPVDV